MIFADDPEKHHRFEDDQVAWSFKRFLESPDLDPVQTVLLPMAKAGFQAMRAVTEFVN